jgi:hypothetical protein
MRKLAFWDVQNFIQGIRIELEGFLPVLCQFFTYVLESHLDSGCTKGASGDDFDNGSFPALPQPRLSYNAGFDA